jgi:hypothetical protein
MSAKLLRADIIQKSAATFLLADKAFDDQDSVLIQRMVATFQFHKAVREDAEQAFEALGGFEGFTGEHSSRILKALEECELVVKVPCTNVRRYSLEDMDLLDADGTLYAGDILIPVHISVKRTESSPYLTVYFRKKGDGNSILYSRKILFKAVDCPILHTGVKVKTILDNVANVMLDGELMHIVTRSIHSDDDGDGDEVERNIEPSIQPSVDGWGAF